ncbi:MAG: hypothetical protein OEQ39_25820 [Gammaproteobacteria bacterium]|nr:hypothetical protein [Gammaproteobacteria bacterium]
MANRKTAIRTIGNAEFDPAKYTRTKSAAGRSSLDCDDKVAKQLRGKSLQEVLKIVARALHDESGGSLRKIDRELKQQYGHLNPGMQRMCLGNRLRKLQ